jgi:hypothetical protein
MGVAFGVRGCRIRVAGERPENALGRKVKKPKFVSVKRAILGENTENFRTSVCTGVFYHELVRIRR